MTQNGVVDVKALPRIGGGTGTLAFVLMGVSGMANPMDLNSLINILWGLVVGLLLSGFYGIVLRIVMSLFNRRYLKEYQQGTIRTIINLGRLYLLPSAVMMCVSVYVLRWSTSAVFISAGLMAVGAAAVMELSRVRGKQALVTGIVVTITTSLFVTGWSISQPYLIRVPGLIQGGILLLRSLMSGGGPL